MANEALCAVFLLGSLSVASFSAYMGKVWLHSFIVAIMLATGITDAKAIMAFGVPVICFAFLLSTVLSRTGTISPPWATALK